MTGRGRGWNQERGTRGGGNNRGSNRGARGRQQPMQQRSWNTGASAWSRGPPSGVAQGSSSDQPRQQGHRTTWNVPAPAVGQPNTAWARGPPPGLAQGSSSDQPRQQEQRSSPYNVLVPAAGQPNAAWAQGPPPGVVQDRTSTEPRQQGHRTAWNVPAPAVGQPNTAWARGPPPGLAQGSSSDQPRQQEQRSSPYNVLVPAAGQPNAAWAQGPPPGVVQDRTSTEPRQQGQRTAWNVPAPAVGQPNTAWARGLPSGVVSSGNSDQPSCSKATTSHAMQRSSDPKLSPAQIPSEADGACALSSAEIRGTGTREKRLLPVVVATRTPGGSKRGVSGKVVKLETNYFKVVKKPEWSIFQYRVDFSPDVEAIGKRYEYIKQHEKYFGGHLFDGTMLFCTRLFPNRGNMELQTKNEQGEVVLIKIKHVGVVKVSDPQQLQILNLILRRAMAGLQLQLVRRNYFDPNSKIKMKNIGLELWPGYETSVRQHEEDILLCAEITHKVIRVATLYDIFIECKAQNISFEHEVIGTVVVTEYNNKTYRIDAVTDKIHPTSTFTQKDGKITTYVDYYQSKHQRTIRDGKQVMLVSHPKAKDIRGGREESILLVPELCNPTGLTDTMRRNFTTMKAIGQHTRLVPDIRIKRLYAFNDRLQQCTQSTGVLNAWNTKLGTDLVQLDGRILPPNIILFGKGKTYTCEESADWTHLLRSRPMRHIVDIKRWCVIAPNKCIREVRSFVGMCISAAAAMDMKIHQPSYLEMPDDRLGTYSKYIEDAAKTDPQILMLVLMREHGDKYNCIKKKCYVDRGILSQVVTLKTVAPKKAHISMATKVVIQMNAKLMGAPWSVTLPASKLMIVGFDVCHSTTDKNQSYGAFVATMDIKAFNDTPNKSMRYFSAVSKHDKGQELSHNISLHMTCALKTYREAEGTLPDRIFFYRDGVGDGQLHQVVYTEVENLKMTLDKIYKSAKKEKGYSLAFIVVSKRINTRFFMNRDNPVPGTVVDDVITLPERYDFFLVSQSVKQGTVSPTSYNVVFDNTGFKPDTLQRLTYLLTHLYYNWSATCRVPAVCQYAHKLAYLTAESLHIAPHSALEKHLYFL